MIPIYENSRKYKRSIGQGNKQMTLLLHHFNHYNRFRAASVF